MIGSPAHQIDKTADNHVERARAAASRGAWQEAYDRLSQAHSAAGLSGEALGFFAEIAYAAGRLDKTIELWELAHAQALGAGDAIGAAGAATRVAMHLLVDVALMAPVRAWVARAERLLEKVDAPAIRAWLAVVSTYERFLSGDRESARAHARRAIEIGTQCEPAAAAIGRVAEARICILDGDVAHGLAMLNEAGLATVSTQLDPLSAGIVHCELVCAAQGLAQYDLAEQWTEAMEHWGQTHAIGSIHGRCRLHRAEILRLRGRLDEAEKEAESAFAELRPYLKRELGWPLTELGRIRLARGDLEGAEEAFDSARDVGWDPEPGASLLRLTRGDVEGAVASIRFALEHPMTVPSKELPPNDELRRALLLSAQPEIEIAAGHVDRARAASEELSKIAERFGSKALVASAAFARAQVFVAERRIDDAHRELATAEKLWDEVGAPREIERVHVERAKLTKPVTRPERTECLFRCEGEYWAVGFEGRVVRLRDSRGMHHLAKLLASPDRELLALDLASSNGHGIAGDAGEMIDARARAAYRARLDEVDDDLEQARAFGDAARIRQAEAEREFLAAELSRAVGLGGRERRAGSASERARASVTRAIRHAIARVHEHHPALGDHLERTIRTGTYCAYAPDPRAPVSWVTRPL